MRVSHLLCLLAAQACAQESNVTIHVSGGSTTVPYFTFTPPLVAIRAGVRYTFVASGLTAGWSFFMRRSLAPIDDVTGSAISGSSGSSFSFTLPVNTIDTSLVYYAPNLPPIFRRVAVVTSAIETSTGGRWNESTAAELISSACTPQEAFTFLGFDSAFLVRSNLGGQGGRCVDQTYSVNDSVTWQEVCDEPESPSMPHEIYIRGLGTTPEGSKIDLRITNESEYRAWREAINGIKAQTRDENVGYFGVINLLGPRSPTMRPYHKFWHEELTIVQLRFTFMNGDPFPLGSNLTIGRTFMTFFDFDTGPGDTNAVEMMQMGPQVRERTQRTSTPYFSA